MQWEFICVLRKHIIEYFVHWSDNWPTIFRTPPQPLTFETKCSLKKINNNETNIEIYFRGTDKLVWWVLLLLLLSLPVCLSELIKLK